MAKSKHGPRRDADALWEDRDLDGVLQRSSVLVAQIRRFCTSDIPGKNKSLEFLTGIERSVCDMRENIDAAGSVSVRQAAALISWERVVRDTIAKHQPKLEDETNG